MTGNSNNESQIGPHLVRVPANPKVPMMSFREQLEVLCLRNGNGSCSQVDETNPPMGAEFTNLLLLEML